MTVIVANDVPPAIRGQLKRWFVELKPNVFVGTLNVRTHQKVMAFISRNAPTDFGWVSITSHPNCQGYVIERFGPQGKSGKGEVELTGLHLMLEK